MRNLTVIKTISIKKLFGVYDVELQLDNIINIYVGENGIGKTTILNCIYYFLSGNFIKLSELPFESIIVKFNNDNLSETILHKSKLDEIISKLRNPLLRRTLIHNNFNGDDAENLELIKWLGPRLNYEPMYQNELIKRALKINVNEYVNEEILYLPTYRRIEVDLMNCLSQKGNERKEYKDINKEDLLLNFGMDDVAAAINDILKEINDISLIEFHKMTRTLLEEYSNLDTSMDVDKEIEKDKLRIVLDRIGNEIHLNIREKILKLVKNGRINDAEYAYLKGLLQKLLDSYEEQRTYDDKINAFVRACNKYLINKKFVYDPNNLKLDIYLNNSNDILALSSLSSGEKQIVSLFAKLHLDKTQHKRIIIIDEPELSLSINWQKMLLPDIYNSNSCSLLITVTHSPFVFQNEFDKYAKDIKQFIR